TGVNLSKMSSAYFWADVIFLFPAGLILDRFSVKRLILIALGLAAASTILFSTAHQLWFAMACHFVAGMGNAFCLLGCVILASRWFPPQRLALVTGWIVTFAMAGGAIAQTPMEILTAHVGWRIAVLINGIFGVLIWVLNWLFVYDRPSNPALDYSRNFQTKPIETLPFFASAKLAASNLQTWLAGIYTSTLNLPLMVLGGLFGSLYLQQAHHFTPEDGATVSSMLFIGTIFGSPAFGKISDNMLRRRLPMILGAVTSLIFTFLMIYTPHFTFFAALIIFFLVGFFTSAQIISYPLIAESNQRTITGTSLGLASFIIMGGAGLAQIVYGVIIDHFWNKLMINGVPQYSSVAYHAAMLLFPITLVVGLICALCIKETYCQNTKQ
ncbi:MAG: MFS transporter, partial [Gammaproteobacteria bacterium]